MLAREVSRQLFCEMVKEIQARKAYIVALYDDQKSKMGIYQIRCLVDGRVYIGSTLNFIKRWWEHRRLLNKNKHHSHRLQKAWNEYGYNAFVWEILEYVYNQDLLLILEDEYLKRIKSANRRFGFNLKPSSERASEETRKKMGEAQIGRKHSEETKRRMREAKLGKKKGEEFKQKMREVTIGKKRGEEFKQKMREVTIGKKMSEEFRQKMREINLGSKHSEESKQKMREAHLGKKMSEESKQKMREANLGKSLSEEHKQKIRESKLGKKMIR